MSFRGKTLPVKIIVQTSLLIAIALVVRNFSYMVYFGSAPAMRIGFSGVFTKTVAILFGPFFGGTASGIVDIIGFMLKPEGPYIPFLTVTAVLGGVISGLLWRATKNIDSVRLQKIFFLLIIIVGGFGIINHILIYYNSSSPWAQIIKKLGKYKDFASIGLEITAAIGIIFFIASIIIRKIHHPDVYGNFLKVLMVTGFSSVFVTTLNTYILQLFIPQLSKTAFIALLVPRVIQEIFITVIQSYIISLLLAIYLKRQ